MKNYTKKAVGLSLVTAVVLGTNAYAGLIKTDAGDVTNPVVEQNKQYGFGGWNMDNVNVLINDTEGLFNNDDGTYSEYSSEDSNFTSEITTEGAVRARLNGKDWPIGEPVGIKVINGDSAVKHGKPVNCILSTTYLESAGLDTANPKPVICSSTLQSHKRFKVNMLPSTVAGVDNGEYGKPIDLVFNLDAGDTSTKRYQIMQKIDNYTGKRLDGYTIEVLDANGSTNPNLTLSLGIGEGDDGDIWASNELATFSHGLWGPVDIPDFPDGGFFDLTRAGLQVTGHGTSKLTGSGNLGSNYQALFGPWLPSRWAPAGIFWDHDDNPVTDPLLVAFWGTVPDAPEGTEPSWHKGIKDNWVKPTSTNFLQWATDPAYTDGKAGDSVNLGLNYIVNVGDSTTIGDTFTIRITPKVSTDTSTPSYIESNGNWIEPVIAIADGTVAISPAPTFLIGDELILSVKDTNLNDTTKIDTTVVTVTTNKGDKETVTLTETEENSAIFTATIASTEGDPVVGDNKVNVVDGSLVTVNYSESGFSTAASTTATTETPVEEEDILNPKDTSGELASSGGGCTSNPNAKSFDMMFLVMMALGLLFPFRRKFIK